MKRLLILLASAVMPLCAAAQGTANTLTYDFQTRTSLGLNWRLAKGLHLEAEYELRTRDKLSAIGRHTGTVGISYKMPFGLKAGLSYSYMYHQGVKSGWNPRHRLSAQLGYTLKAGDWNFSIKETFRWTHKTESLNPFQENADPLTLKSRIKATYKGWKPVEPYIFAEVRNVFNDPNVNATWSTSSQQYGNYSFGGYGDTYFNRIRACLGAEWKLSKRHALDFYVMEDYCYDKNLDVSKDGTLLKSFTWDRALNTIAGVGYVFSF
ncbi:MAG: DUF2490 domain-containing protein [Bacteroidales bacterium]|nr:DUF2490 domain-containing protein [Bacteroidales bacterium]